MTMANKIPKTGPEAREHEMLALVLPQPGIGSFGPSLPCSVERGIEIAGCYQIVPLTIAVALYPPPQQALDLPCRDLSTGGRGEKPKNPEADSDLDEVVRHPLAGHPGPHANRSAELVRILHRGIEEAGSSEAEFPRNALHRLQGHGQEVL